MPEDSPYEISVVHRGGRSPVETALLNAAVVRTLRLRDCHRARVSVVLVDDQQIALLNEEYLQHSGPTDVLSFNLTDPWDQGVDGELIVSTETAEREAAARGHDPAAEVLLYLVHGTLHLTGMDDADAGGARSMHELEDRILSEMGIGPVYQPAGK